jgi:hypothetical protein
MFILYPIAKALFLFQKMWENMEKNMEKVANYFPNELFPQGSGN